MLPGHPRICLYKPEIPQNTGNIARLTAATGSRLCLVKPFGFSTDDKNLERPGLDYWPFLDLEVYDDLEELLIKHSPKVAFYSKKATKLYTECPKDTELFVFGQESKGLPDDLMNRFPESQYRIPIFHPGVRSLNLSNAVAIVVYHQLNLLNAK